MGPCLRTTHRSGPTKAHGAGDLDGIDAMTAAPDGTGGTEPARDASGEGDACAGAERFALMVLGESMAPEFEHGDVIIIEPDAEVHEGCFVLALSGREWLFRQLQRENEDWRLCALNPRFASVALPDRSLIRGVVIQKSRPGQRSATRRYVE